MSIKYNYKQFPPAIELTPKLNSLVCEARTELGRYDAFLSSMHNGDILLSPLFTQEAVLSSRIEGTQSSLSEVLAFDAKQDNDKLSEEKRNDIVEILNYRKAMFNTKNELATIPLSQRVFKNAHKILMEGSRGQNKDPGNYRKIPVWIGPDKSNIDTARFIPLDAQNIHTAMGDLEKYIHNDDTYDDFIKAAIFHAEFESIHPFLDGNGRLGRMLLPLYLWQKKLLATPSFYMSSYLEKHRQQYYDLLLNISKNGDWLSWCVFFVEGIKEQAKDNLTRANKIVHYYNNLKEEIPKISKSPYGITALDFLFKNTYFNSTTFYQKSGVPKTIAKRLLDTFVDNGVIDCRRGSGRKPNFYLFKHLIDIADGK